MSSLPSADNSQFPPTENSDLSVPPIGRTRTRTPLETQFETWTQNLKPGFTPTDVDAALRAQSDPDLALDIFRWTAQQRNYKHNHVTYLTMIKTLIDVSDKANEGLRCDTGYFCFEYDRQGLCYLSRGDEAIRVFREMGLYGCYPNAYSYSYVVKGLCEKGRVEQGLGFYKEMKGKLLVPSGSTYMILICSLAIEGRFEEAIEVLFDMLGQSRAPDLLTYKTVLEGLCREGKSDEAFELLEECRKRDRLMSQKTYKTLLNSLHFLNQE
ncbi:hypothetical protein GH714_025448 [Hevea brasiliensis]|uniref:Pentacotripeptide-repeat region of PRORP domain-containing protein n=1 Tax=Hevea brasiliensis TaxID=3981 RepID=A0A6A6KX52_HEVBR|nr:hypothetical protein GH714_025448 [Hevea brasiliensis]